MTFLFFIYRYFLLLLLLLVLLLFSLLNILDYIKQIETNSVHNNNNNKIGLKIKHTFEKKSYFGKLNVFFFSTRATFSSILYI